MLLAARKSLPSVRFGGTPVSHEPVQAWSCRSAPSGLARLLTMVRESRNGSSGFKMAGSSKPEALDAGVHWFRITPCGT